MTWLYLADGLCRIINYQTEGSSGSPGPSKSLYSCPIYDVCICTDILGYSDDFPGAECRGYQSECLILVKTL